MSTPSLTLSYDDVVLGAELRRARKKAGVTARELASRIGCSSSHISQLERGLSSPSVMTLFRIVTELGISVDDLFKTARSDSLAKRSEPGSEYFVRSLDHHCRVLHGGVEWEMLTPTAEDGFEFTEFTYEVGGSDGKDFLRRAGRIYGVALSGQLGCEVGSEEFVVEAGDTVAFDSMIPHRFWNAGDVPARTIFVWRRDVAGE